MRAALVLGISDYANLTPLPSCQHDALAFAQLLESTGRYSDARLCLTGAVNAENAKTQILTFLETLTASSIEEVLLYFSGHGAIADGELLLLCSDFNESSKRQTSIQNSEIDAWLRARSPNVAVKIIDACSSGVSYVKDDERMYRALEKSKPSFRNCYFLASSEENRPSFAGDHLSLFTEKLFEAISQRPNGPLRYKTLVDAVGDTFEGSALPIPYFVLQGDLSHTFFDLNEEHRAVLHSLLPPAADPIASPSAEEGSAGDEPLRSPIEILRADAEKCLTKDDAESLLKKIEESLAETSLQEDLSAAFDLVIAWTETWMKTPPYAWKIGRWISKLGEPIFARAEVTEHEIEDGTNPYFRAVAGVPLMRKQTEITGFVSTIGFSVRDYALVQLRPRYPNLREHHAGFVFFFSERKVHLMSFVVAMHRRSWSEFDYPDNLKWSHYGAEKSSTGTLIEAVRQNADRLMASAREDLASVVSSLGGAVAK